MNNFFSHAVNEELKTIYCSVKSDMRRIKLSPIINWKIKTHAMLRKVQEL